MRIRYNIVLVLFFIMSGFNFLLSSCTKNNLETTNQPIVLGKDQLAVDLVVAQEYGEMMDKSASISSGNENIQTAQSGDLFVEISSSSRKKSDKIADVNPPNTNLISLPYRTPYKIIVLNSENEYVAEKVAYSGVAISFDIVLEPTYKVIAYTYNTSDTLLYTHKLGSLDNRTVLSKPWIVPNREFYYATSPIYVDAQGKKKISLKFIPKVARIGISINVEAIFAKIQGPIKLQTLNNNYFKGGKFNLLDQSISNVGAQPSFSAVDLNGNIVATSVMDRYVSSISNAYTGNSVVTGYFYTLVENDGRIAEQEGASNYFARVNFIGNSITGTLNNEIVYTETRRVNNADLPLKEKLDHTFSFSDGFTGIQLGKSKTFTFKIYRGFPYNNLLWSTTNLIHTGGVNYRTESYIFRRYPYDGFQQPAKDYWAPNKLIPGVSSNDVNTGDPCSKVFPVNEWRMPTLSEFEALFNTGSGLTRSRNLSDNLSVQRHTLIRNTTNTSSEIKFYYFGRAGLSVSNGVPYYTYYNDSEEVGGEANYLFKENTGNVISEKHYFTAAWQTLYYGNSTLTNEANRFRNVRCVRSIPTN